jgi:hypothetical protein
MYKREYSSYAWLKYSILACWCYGISNALMGVLASKYNVYGILLLSPGQLFNWCVYHASVTTQAYNNNRLA